MKWLKAKYVAIRRWFALFILRCIIAAAIRIDEGRIRYDVLELFLKAHDKLKERGKTHEEIASAFGISPRRLSEWLITRAYESKTLEVKDQ